MHAHIILCSFCVGLHGNSILVVKNDHSTDVFSSSIGEGCLNGAVPWRCWRIACIDYPIYPDAPCMEYLPTFTIKFIPKWVNIPYMDMGYIDVVWVVFRTSFLKNTSPRCLHRTVAGYLLFQCIPGDVHPSCSTHRCKMWGPKVVRQTQRIHGTGIFAYMKTININQM